jgi:hypothetical protein
MKTIKTVEIEPVFVEFLPSVDKMEEGKVYISQRFKTSGHRCLCGCGHLTILPLDVVIDGQDMGWHMTEKDGKVSFTPSIGNYQLPCKSHYIITKNKANFV